MLGSGLLKGLGITAKHTFEKEITQQYPEQRPYLQNRFRGSLAYDFPKCIACGLCTKACPNNVLTLNTFKDENTGKKQVDNFVIDLQYCLACNLCVEVCPTDTLYFTKDFELTQRNRDAIRRVYLRPPELKAKREEPEAASPADSRDGAAEAEKDKRLQQVAAIRTALAKNPAKVLAKMLSTETDIAIMTDILKNEDKQQKLAEVMVKDRDKAAKVAAAWVQKARQDDSRKGGDPV